MEQDDLLSRLAKKAKRKLNKQNEEDEVCERQNLAQYEFKKSDQSSEQKKLEKKIAQLLKNNPDCTDPIGKLIDHSVYDELSEEKKQAYVFKLSAKYCEICQKLKAL